MGETGLKKILLSLIIVNAAGFTLKYFNLDTYIIIVGFRFHLSCVIPLLIIYPANFAGSVKRFFTKPDFKGKFIPVIWIILSAAIIPVGLYALNKIDIGDPDYFYEFGLSSVFDFPIYLLWNFPQLTLLFSYLYFSSSSNKNKFLPVLFITISLFAYEVTPLETKTINYIPFIELLLASVSTALFFQFYRNVYWFAVIFFTTIWSNLLLYGTYSVSLTNIFFASQYSGWEGFLTTDKLYAPYLFSAQLLLLVVMMLIFIPLSRIKLSAEVNPTVKFNSENVTEEKPVFPA